MSGERFVILGLASPRASWFRAVAQWANAAALPAEFVKCLSADEVVQRVESGRPHSALLVDAGLPGVDRDLIATAALAGCPTFVVDDPRVRRDWSALGARCVLAQTFTRAHLADALAEHARLIERGVEQVHEAAAAPAFAGIGNRLVAVTGAGGAGSSTVAIAVAQGLAGHGDDVLLADLCLDGEQAMLHDAADPGMGIQALVEAHRTSRLGPNEIRELCAHVPARGYDLLPGLRRARFWSSIRPVAFQSAFAALRSTYGTVVCDVDADVETEESGGSVDVEERTSMTRSALAGADVVVIVGAPSMKGLHSLNRILVELGDVGIDLSSVVVTFNQSPRSPRVRAGYSSALAELLRWRGDRAPRLSPVHLPVRDVDHALRIGEPLPAAIVGPITSAVQAQLGSTLAMAGSDGSGSAIRRLLPGSLRSGDDRLDLGRAG